MYLLYIIELNYNLLEGQALIIDTRPSKIRVEIYDHIGRPYIQGQGIPAFEYVDVGSSFFTLKPGNNTIKFSSTGGSPEVYLYYREQYTGV